MCRYRVAPIERREQSAVDLVAAVHSQNGDGHARAREEEADVAEPEQDGEAHATRDAEVPNDGGACSGHNFSALLYFKQPTATTFKQTTGPCSPPA